MASSSKRPRLSFISAEMALEKKYLKMKTPLMVWTVEKKAI